MKQFKTESKKLLDLMINSIYTNREIFLRELVSNASDAIDKLSFAALTDSSVSIDQDDLAIRVAFDKDARTITVSDNGIGMTEEELEENLGTIAHSGSEAFKAEHGDAQGDAMDIIGQFGVGFYSSFMVAERVRVVSRAFGSDQAFAWESDGIEGYTIEPAAAGERDGEGDHGTDVILYLRESTEAEDTDRFLSEWGLRDLIKRYSNYVRHPIQMMVTKSEPVENPEDLPEDAPRYVEHQELETINSMTPIWKKRQSEVEQDDYDEFYKSTFHDYTDPARTISFHAEGSISYDALLFIPGEAPFRPLQQGLREGPRALQLQRAHPGEVRRPAARLLQLRARRGGQPRRHAQHQPRDAAAEPPAARHRQARRAQDQERAADDARRRPRGLREVLRELWPRHQVWHLQQLWHERRRAGRPAAVLERQGGEVRHAARVRAGHARGPRTRSSTPPATRASVWPSSLP